MDLEFKNKCLLYDKICKQNTDFRNNLTLLRMGRSDKFLHYYLEPSIEGGNWGGQASLVAIRLVIITICFFSSPLSSIR